MIKRQASSGGKGIDDEVWGQLVELANAKHPMNGDSHHGHRRDVVIWLYTDNIDALHALLKERVHITDKPTDASYGVREFGIEDPNGFELMFAQRLEE